MGLPARRPVGTEADDGTRERQTPPRPPSLVCREYRPGGLPRDRRLLSIPRTPSASARLAALPYPSPVSVDPHLHAWRTLRLRGGTHLVRCGGPATSLPHQTMRLIILKS